MIEKEILLHAIMYRVTLADEWTAIFTTTSPIGGRPSKFMMHRTPTTIWYFQHVDGWGDTPAGHIVAAYEWCKARLGDDFALERLPDEEVKPHKWRFREKIKCTICDDCWETMSDQTRFVSCRQRISKALELGKGTFNRDAYESRPSPPPAPPPVSG